MQNQTELFKKKLQEYLCRRVMTKDMTFSNNKVVVNIIIDSMEQKAEKYLLKGIRCCGYIDFGGDPKNRKELCDLQYKIANHKDGVIAHYLKSSVETVLFTALKHFDMDSSHIDIMGEVNYIKQKRFFCHTKRMLLKD